MRPTDKYARCNETRGDVIKRLAIRGALLLVTAAVLQMTWHYPHYEAPVIALLLAVVVQGFFLGMVANLIPFAPGGVGAVDAGLIGAYVLFGLPESTVFAAVLVYRLIAFWMPIPPGAIAFFQLRGTVARWEREGRPVERIKAVTSPAPAS